MGVQRPNQPQTPTTYGKPLEPYNIINQIKIWTLNAHEITIKTIFGQPHIQTQVTTHYFPTTPHILDTWLHIISICSNGYIIGLLIACHNNNVLQIAHNDDLKPLSFDETKTIGPKTSRFRLAFPNYMHHLLMYLPS